MLTLEWQCHKNFRIWGKINFSNALCARFVKKYIVNSKRSIKILPIYFSLFLTFFYFLIRVDYRFVKYGGLGTHLPRFILKSDYNFVIPWQVFFFELWFKLRKKESRKPYSRVSHFFLEAVKGFSLSKSEKG